MQIGEDDEAMNVKSKTRMAEEQRTVDMRRAAFIDESDSKIEVRHDEEGENGKMTTVKNT